MCTRCGLDVPLDGFHHDRTRVDGFSKWCKRCVSENSRKHYQANRESIRARAAEQRSQNPEHFREISRASLARTDPTGEKKRAYNRARYGAKREEILAKAKVRHRLVKYGVTAEQFDALLRSQRGACAICRVESEDWHIDHDHSCCPTIRTCGKCIRGVLCRACNMGLGIFKDDAAILESAISYLRGK